MKGDFSVWKFDPHDNDQGVLYQQGRVISDADLTAAERIALGWRTQAGRDLIGRGVAAVPADEPGGFKVNRAYVSDGEVHLEIGPGRAWADGVLLYLPADPDNPSADIDRVAAYYEPPISAAAATPQNIDNGTRDVVVLELALEALSGFEDVERLIEPALGGPDTAGRITARHEFRLARIAAGETCQLIRGRLKDTDAGKGRLTVSLQDPVTTSGECPTVEGGGYAGFEHNLYRIEIALTDLQPPNSVPVTPPTHFKWSVFNGGLTGTGIFDSGQPVTGTSTTTVELRGNRTAILMSGFTEFYLEAVEYNAAIGIRRVTYATKATLNSNGELELAQPATYGTPPSTTGPVFFRLWNGIEAIADYTDTTDPEELQDGIRLVFEDPASYTYRAGDYWTFSVRAGEIANEQTLLDTAPPHGLELRRVPLAEIKWSAQRDTDLGGEIEDCRRRFHPLTSQKVCCSLLVGDGLTSFGDFNSLEEAAAHLPTHGGELCLLPGIHFANLVLDKKRDIRIHGCPRRTLLLPRLAGFARPIIQLVDCTGIQLQTMDLFAPFGIAIDASGSDFDSLKDLAIEDSRILALTYGVRVDHGRDIAVARNQLWILDRPQGMAALSLRILDGLVERNRLGVWPVNLTPPPTPGIEQPDPADDCIKPDDIYDSVTGILAYLVQVWTRMIQAPPPQPYRATGGIHLRGGCERVRLLQNKVDGGAGHGITLGGILPGETPPQTGPSEGENAPTVTSTTSPVAGFVRDADGSTIADVTVFLFQNGSIAGQSTSLVQGYFSIKVEQGVYTVAVEPGYEIVKMREDSFERTPYYVIVVRQAAIEVSDDLAALYRIAIEDNEITRMALSGIGFLTHTGQNPAVFLPEFSGAQTIAAIIAAMVAPRELLLTTNMVGDLVIRGNRIHHNLRVVFNDVLRQISRIVGSGGISLALVESATIADNHIHDNGLSAVDPCCGIFIAYGEGIDIAGNHIANNGPLVANYASARSDGIRGGIFIRLASALLLGGETDALQKPALRITDNRVDQPAGRALTVAAFGPVACTGNSFNSEREGLWSVIDAVFGTVLIVNVGSIHRQLLFCGEEVAAAETNLLFTNRFTVNSFANPVLTEVLMPGGEVLFNSNQVRMGPRHQAILSQLLMSLGDVGYDGNQCAVFRPDFLFGNLVCAGQSVRVTANRFKEHTRVCALSSLSFAFGVTPVSRGIAMSTTANNQGDHCIFGMSNAPAGGLPVIDDNNLELFSDFCRCIAHEPAQIANYVQQALALTIFAQASQPLTVETMAAVSRESMTASMESISAVRGDLHYVNARETRRLEMVEGSASPRVKARRDALVRHARIIATLDNQNELVRIDEVPAPEEGNLIDGRINDAGGRGLEGASVQIVGANGRPLDIAGRTDRTGYFAIPLSAEQARLLARQRQIYFQVVDEQDNVLHRDREARKVTADRTMRVTIDLSPMPTPARSNSETGRVIFEGGRRIGSTPLENIRGIGPVRAERLREAGIADVEALMRLPAARLIEIVGMDADVVRREAAEAIRRGRGDGE
jgi:hypothetical protein